MRDFRCFGVVWTKPFQNRENLSKFFVVLELFEPNRSKTVKISQKISLFWSCLDQTVPKPGKSLKICQIWNCLAKIRFLVFSSKWHQSHSLLHEIWSTFGLLLVYFWFIFDQKVHQRVYEIWSHPLASTANQQPAASQPAQPQPASNQPASQQAGSQQPAASQAASSQQPASQQPQPASTASQPAASQPASQQPASQQARSQPASQDLIIHTNHNMVVYFSEAFEHPDQWSLSPQAMPPVPQDPLCITLKAFMPHKLCQAPGHSLPQATMAKGGSKKQKQAAKQDGHDTPCNADHDLFVFENCL